MAQHSSHDATSNEEQTTPPPHLMSPTTRRVNKYSDNTTPRVETTA